MAAAFNNISTPILTVAWDGGAFTSTTSVTVAASQDYLLVRIGNSNAQPTSITYAGNALTELFFTGDTNNRSVGTYYLASPPAGTADLVITNPGSTTYQSSIDEISGVSGIGATSSVGGSQSNSSVALATAIGDLVLDILSSDQTATVGAGQTAGLLNTNNLSTSSETATTTSTTMDWTHASDHVVHTAVVFTAGAAGPTISATTDPVVDGVSNSITTSNLSGSASGTLGGATLSLSGTFPNLTYTYNWRTISSNTTGPRIGDSLTLAITGDEGTATTTVATQEGANDDLTELAGTLDKSANSLLANIDSTLGVTTAVTDKILFESRDNTAISATGVLTTDATDNIQMYLFQGGDATTPSNIYPFEVNGGTGEVVVAWKKLTYSKLTGVKLTAKKLEANKL